MNWPSIIIGAGISAWVHGLIAALGDVFGLPSFAHFGVAIGVASAAVFLIGLIARAVHENVQNQEAKTLVMNERYESRYQTIDKRLGMVEKKVDSARGR